MELAADHDGFLRGFGGTYGGEIATSMMPPSVPGATKADPYNFLANKNGDVNGAKAELVKCGQPNGFTTNMAYRAERPKEKAEGEALQQSLAKVGIKVNLKPYPEGDYFKLYAGKPDYAKANDLGLSANGWGADWPDGFGFLSQIVDSRVIRATGGASNLSVKDPKVDSMLDQALSTTDVGGPRENLGPDRRAGHGRRLRPSGRVGEHPALPPEGADERVRQQRPRWLLRLHDARRKRQLTSRSVAARRY